MLTYTGTLKVKNAEVRVSDKFRKREFVVTDNANAYPNLIQFQLTQDRCSLLDGANVGDEITVHFSLKGREWKNPQGEIKYFNTLDAFKIEKITRTATSGSTATATAAPSATLTPTPDDDLPF